jgi:hypothetical protein
LTSVALEFHEYLFPECGGVGRHICVDHRW